MTVYTAPGQPDSLVSVDSRYGHYIGGEWVDPVKGEYFENISPVNGKPFTEIARGTAEDIDAALDAAHAACPAWGKTSATERANILQQDRRPDGGEPHDARVAETWENGKPVRETLAADLPLAVDHFRYFAGVLRAQEGTHRRDRREHRGLPLPRAARRRRPDHPVELPDPDGGLEARSGARGRQLRRPQACRADPVVDPQADRARRRPAARRRAQHRQRLRRRGRQAARLAATGSRRSRSPARPRPAG